MLLAKQTGWEVKWCFEICQNVKAKAGTGETTCREGGLEQNGN